jgi:hypothetical protein
VTAALTMFLVGKHSTEYCVDRDLFNPEESARACHAVMDVVLPKVKTAWIDAYSDEVHLPDEARQAQEALFRMGQARPEGDPGVGIDLDVRIPAHVELLRTFAPWSINVELYDASMRWLATMTDTGYSVCFNVTEEDALRIKTLLGNLPITTLEPHARRKR